MHRTRSTIRARSFSLTVLAVLPVLATACAGSDSEEGAESSEIGNQRVRIYVESSKAVTCSNDPELEPTKLSALTRLRVGPSTPDIEKRLLRPFFSDGCSESPDGMPPDDTWQHCCVEHDAKYYLGGTEGDKRAPDEELAACITNTGHPTAGAIYKAAVQRFGGPDGWMLYR
jgi:hypothetical protein